MFLFFSICFFLSYSETIVASPTQIINIDTLVAKDTQNGTYRDPKNGFLGLYYNPKDPISRIAASAWSKIFDGSFLGLKPTLTWSPATTTTQTTIPTQVTTEKSSTTTSGNFGWGSYPFPPFYPGNPGIWPQLPFPPLTPPPINHQLPVIPYPHLHYPSGPTHGEPESHTTSAHSPTTHAPTIEASTAASTQTTVTQSAPATTMSPTVVHGPGLPTQDPHAPPGLPVNFPPGINPFPPGGILPITHYPPYRPNDPNQPGPGFPPSFPPNQPGPGFPPSFPPGGFPPRPPGSYPPGFGGRPSLANNIRAEIFDALKEIIRNELGNDLGNFNVTVYTNHTDFRTEDGDNYTLLLPSSAENSNSNLPIFPYNMPYIIIPLESIVDLHNNSTLTLGPNHSP